MHISRLVSLALLVLVVTIAVSALQQPIEDAKEEVVERAEEQEEATEHAPISHEKAPAALEDVDEFKGLFGQFLAPKISPNETQISLKPHLRNKTSTFKMSISATRKNILLLPLFLPRTPLQCQVSNSIPRPSLVLPAAFQAPKVRLAAGTEFARPTPPAQSISVIAQRAGLGRIANAEKRSASVCRATSATGVGLCHCV
jgi:hypothetical protein